jgi:aspartate kinase
LPAAPGTTQFQSRPAEVTPPSGRDLVTLTQQLAGMEDIVVSDVLLTTDQGRITVFDLPDKPGNCSKVFQAVAGAGIVVDMIVQNLTGGRGELSFSVPQADLGRAEAVTRSVVRDIDAGTRVVADPAIAKLFVLGVGMRTHTGVARRMFGALATRGINISMINTSEVRVSVVVDRSRGEEALACLREAFGVG